MLEVLELEVSNGSSSKAQGETRLVALVQEVPDINSISLGDEDDSRPSRRESPTSIVRTKGVGRAEDRLLKFLQGSFPNAEVKVMHCQKYVFVKGRTLQS